MKSSNVTNALLSAFVSSSVVFGVGFILGVFRTLVLVPKFGELRAVLIESPLILPASWIVTQWAIAKYNISPELSTRCIMGIAAFVFLMEWELAMSVLLFGKTIREFCRHALLPSTAPGIVGLGGQLIYGAYPVIQGIKADRGASRTKQKPR